MCLVTGLCIYHMCGLSWQDMTNQTWSYSQSNVEQHNAVLREAIQKKLKVRSRKCKTKSIYASETSMNMSIYFQQIMGQLNKLEEYMCVYIKTLLFLVSDQNMFLGCSKVSSGLTHNYLPSVQCAAVKILSPPRLTQPQVWLPENRREHCHG